MNDEPWRICTCEMGTTPTGHLEAGKKITVVGGGNTRDKVQRILAALDLINALQELHRLHGSFKITEYWTEMDDKARTKAEEALAKAGSYTSVLQRDFNSNAN
jgi:hypothetical protein